MRHSEEKDSRRQIRDGEQETDQGQSEAHANRSLHVSWSLLSRSEVRSTIGSLVSAEE